MDELNKSKVSIGAVVIIIVLTAIIFGGGTYVYLGDKAKKEGAASTSQLKDTTPGVYTDKAFGFSLTLPPNNYVFRNENFEGGHNVALELGKKTGDLTLDNSYIRIAYINSETTLEELKKEAEKGGPVIKSTPIKVDGQNSIKYELGGFDHGYKVIAAKNKNYVTFDAYPSDDSSVLDGIISSFKFGN